MSKISNLNSMIPIALEYYDKNKKMFNNFFKKIHKTETIKNSKDMEKNKLLFYDKDSKLLLESSYEIIGLFYNKYNTWIWSWAIPNLSKNKILISRKLLNYALDIDITQDENKQFKYIKSELITSRTQITSKLQLDIYLSLVSYLSKKRIIYKKRYFLNKDEPDNYIDYYFFVLDEEIVKDI
jgi:hypothetical protein